MKKVGWIFSILCGVVLLFAGCQKTTPVKEGTLNVVTTTTMLSDLTKIIGGEHVTVNGLMGTGIDPHSYQASAGDVIKLQEADLVVHTGLHLEGKMGDIFKELENQDKSVITIEDGLDPDKLIYSKENEAIPDPHIWFDVANWKAAAEEVTRGLSEKDPANQADYEANLAAYLVELDELDTYIRDRVAELPEDERILVTAHDAFEYFGQAYGFEVVGLQGISTEAEAGTADVSDLAAFISEHHVKAIFVESSVSPKTIQALQAAVKAKGNPVEIGGELYSDSLGDEKSGDETYIKTFKKNIDTIIEALK